MSDVNNTSPASLWSTLNRRNGLALLFASAVAIGSLMAAHASFAEDKKAIKVGIISGEDEDVWRVVVAQAAEKGLTIETVVFNDYTQPNEALERGEIDANAFQHRRPGVTERIELGDVGQRLFLFADFFLDERTPLITG